MTVVYNRAQVYPQYIVTYSRRPTSRAGGIAVPVAPPRDSLGTSGGVCVGGSPDADADVDADADDDADADVDGAECDADHAAGCETDAEANDGAGARQRGCRRRLRTLALPAGVTQRVEEQAQVEAVQARSEAQRRHGSDQRMRGQAEVHAAALDAMQHQLDQARADALRATEAVHGMEATLRRLRVEAETLAVGHGRVTRERDEAQAMALRITKEGLEGTRQLQREHDAVLKDAQSHALRDTRRIADLEATLARFRDEAEAYVATLDAMQRRCDQAECDKLRASGATRAATQRISDLEATLERLRNQVEALEAAYDGMLRQREEARDHALLITKEALEGTRKLQHELDAARVECTTLVSQLQTQVAELHRAMEGMRLSNAEPSEQSHVIQRPRRLCSTELACWFGLAFASTAIFHCLPAMRSKIITIGSWLSQPGVMIVFEINEWVLSPAVYTFVAVILAWCLCS